MADFARWIDAVKPESYNDVAARRYGAAEARPDSFSNKIAPRILRTVAQARASELRVLDIGSGTGQLLDVLRAAGLDTVGVDYSLPMLERRASLLSGSPGNAVQADAAHLPLNGPFDLITATFNVLNHLPNLESVESTVQEVARLLGSDGLFIFDINTRLGLTGTESLTVVQDSPDDKTEWQRHWHSPDVLRLEASGTFLDGDDWHRYEEVIDKMVISVSWLEDELTKAGLGQVTWVSDDLVTPLDNPERHAVAFALVKRSA